MQTGIVLGLKIDVDTARGTRVGVKNLLQLFERHNIHASFLFSLGPDNTGRAIKRIFRPGFFAKVSRTSVISVYGLKTLMNGILWPGPNIAKKYGRVMQDTHKAGHEVGIHTYDHIRWQDQLHEMTEPEVRHEVTKAAKAFESVFNFPALTMGAAGWQANKASLSAYDDMGFVYASDARGKSIFYPKVKTRVFKTPQVPTTLPTLDELLGRPEYPLETLHEHFISLMKPGQLNTLTIHAELEGMKYLEWFDALLTKLKEQKIKIVPIRVLADQALADKKNIPICNLEQGTLDGRSGTLAVQGS